MRRRRMVLLGAAGLLIVACGVGGMRWASRQAPTFYTTALHSNQPKAARRDAARKFAEQTADLVRELQYASRWEQVFSQQQVNAWLAEELPRQFERQIPPGVSDPRVQFEEGLIWFGFQLRNDQFDGIVSVSLRPESTGPNRVSVTVESLSAGLLPLTASAFTDDVSKQLDRYDIEHSWDTAAGKQVLHLEIVPTRADHPVLEEIDVDDRRVRIAGYRERPRALTMREEGGGRF